MGGRRQVVLLLLLPCVAANSSNFSDWELQQSFNHHQLNMLAIICLTMFLALVGNGFLFFVILRTRKRGGGQMTPVHILILHSCINDILFALLTLFPQVMRMVTFPRFYGGPLMCPLLMFLNVVPMYGSSLLLVAISADRYTAVCRPLASLGSSKHRRAHVLAGLGWAAAALLSTPQLAIFRLQTSPGGEFCVSFYVADWLARAYVVWFTLAAWLIPSLVSAAFYTAVCRQVWRSLANPGVPDRKSALSAIVVNGKGDPAFRNSDARKHQSAHMSNQRAKTVKLTLTIVVCNFILYGPFCISNVIYAYIPEHVDPVAIMYIMLIGNLNSCVNPWIYLLFNFRQARDSLKAFSRRERNRSAAAAFSANFPLTAASPRAGTLNGARSNASGRSVSGSDVDASERRRRMRRMNTNVSLPPLKDDAASCALLMASAKLSTYSSPAVPSHSPRSPPSEADLPQTLKLPGDPAELDESFVTCRGDDDLEEEEIVRTPSAQQNQPIAYILTNQAHTSV